MKKGILVAILALFTGVILVGCGQKTEETQTENTTDTVSTQDQVTEESVVEDTNDTEESGNNQDTSTDEQQQETSMELGAQTVQGETLEGNIYNGKYRLTNASDRVVVEWTENAFKNKTEYVFSGDKLSAINFERTYSTEDQAKADYETASKQNEEVKKAKNLTLEGATIKYTFEDEEWKEIKDFTKQQIFEEQRKVFEELSKIDDKSSEE